MITIPPPSTHTHTHTDTFTHSRTEPVCVCFCGRKSALLVLIQEAVMVRRRTDSQPTVKVQECFSFSSRRKVCEETKQTEANLSFKKQLNSCFSPCFHPPLSELTDLLPDPVSSSLTALFESLFMFLLISSNLLHAHPPLHHQNAVCSHDGGLLLLLHFNGKAVAWKTVRGLP